MWPLHVRTKDQHVRLIQARAERCEVQPLQQAILEAVADYEGEEDFVAWCTSVAHDMRCEGATSLLAQFVDQFPLSLYPVQVDLAESLILAGELDQGSNEARAYLHRLNDAGIAQTVVESEFLGEGCLRAMLMLTAVYTELGARSYSRRVLEYALLLPCAPEWRQRFQAEHVRLGQELRDPAQASADRMWEALFHRGECGEEVTQLCKRQKAPILAARVGTISRLFSSEPGYRPNDDEMFQLLYETDRGALILV